MAVGTVSKVGRTYSVDSRLISVETGESYISAQFDIKDEIDILLKSGMTNIAEERQNINQTSLPFEETLYAGKGHGIPEEKEKNLMLKFIVWQSLNK